MKPYTFTSLVSTAVFAAAALALPLTAAPKDDLSSGYTQAQSGATASASISDRRIDFGKPVRFVKNTFTRDKDSTSVKRDDSERRGATQLRKQDEKRKSLNPFWNSESEQKSMKKDKKEGPLSRLLNWRPFNRDRDS